MIKVGIIGGAGYTAGEAIRILSNHPNVELAFVNSTSNAGNKLYDVHSGLVGETEMTFTEALPLNEVDAIFICSGHGDSRKFLESHDVPSNLKIIDLSQDFRDESDGFVYGLPEVNRDRIRNANKVANPGCFATAIQIGLLPLAQNGLLKGDVHTNGITGSTGAGVKLSATSHFSWRNNNVSIYKAFKHQHLLEINRMLKKLQPGFSGEVNFLPVRGDFPRGIFVSSYTECALELEEIQNISALDLHNKGIYSLEGIGYFVNLRELNCAGNMLSRLNLQNNSQACSDCYFANATWSRKAT